MEQKIRERKGLNPSTLRMWRIKGIIDQGELGPHPIKGRGRVRTYSPATVDKIETIVDLRRKEGLSLKAAVARYEKELAEKLEFVNKLKLGHLLKKEKIKLNGITLDAIEFCESAILASLMPFVQDVKAQRKILRQLRKDDLVNHAWIMLVSGFSPCLTWDGSTIRITPDFMIAHNLSQDSQKGKPFVVATLYPIFETLLQLMGREPLVLPTAKPAPKVWITYGEDTVEFDLRLGGEIGFEVDRESGRRMRSRTRTTK
jgi:DNA-binding transcriptional MerR regulator